MAVVLDFEVEPSLHAMIGRHAISQFFGRATVQLRHGHGSHAVLDVDGNGLTQFYAFYIFQGRNEIESDMTIFNFNILCMEITLVPAVVIDAYALLNRRLHFQIPMDNQRSTWLNERRVVTETLQISLFCAVDIQMVGVGGGDYTHPRTQPMKTAVELIGLDNDIITRI